MSFLREWFLDLDDTPDDYTGHAGETVTVKATEDGLEFGEITGGGGFPDHQHPDPLEQAFELTDAPDGGWSWFGDPRAVHHNGVTYFGFVSGTTGDVSVAAFDHETRTVTITLIAAAFNQDDHANPSILIRNSDSRVMVFYSRHNGDDMWLRISTDPESIASFGTAVNLDSQLGGVDYTYPNPLELVDDGEIWLLYRRDVAGGQHQWAYSISTDDGATWASETVLMIQAGRASYWKIGTNGRDRIDFGVCDGSPNVDAAVSIWHFYWHDGDFRTTDGTPITPVLDNTDLTLVYDGAVGHSSLLWDAALDPITGHPRIVWVGFPSTSDHRYFYGRWSGSAWQTHEIVAGGDKIAAARPYYSGGLSLDHDRPAVVYASIETGTGVFDVFRLTTTDGGETWTQQRLTDDGIKTIRPFAVRGSTPDLHAVWMAADTYTEYTNYSAGTDGSGHLPVTGDGGGLDLFANGTDTIPDTETDVTVAHGLGVIPETVVVTAREVVTLGVTARDVTTFTAARTGSSDDLDFDWIATGDGTPPGEPGDLPVTDGLVMWLDARLVEGLSDDDPLAPWEDESGEGNDATQPTSAARPRWRTNRTPAGEPAVQFVSANVYEMILPAIFNIQSGTTIMLARPATTQTMFSLAGRSSGSSNDRWYFNLWANTGNVQFYAGGSGTFRETPYSPATWYRPALRADGNTKSAFLDGSQVGADWSDANIGSPTTVRLGRSPTGGSHFNGDVALILHYNRALTSQELSDVDDWIVATFITP